METLKMKFNYPYKEAGDRCRKEALSWEGYDPVSLFRWGNMLGMSVLRMLEAGEREFGPEGQKAMIDALAEVGRDIGRQMLEGVEPPEDIEPIEFLSSFASWINREIYASPEDPRIEDEDHCEFDILWCPHQDSYKAFDCRVQRYLVQGMMDAAKEKIAGAGFGEGMEFNVKVVQTIPAGGKVCTFKIWRKREGEDDDWSEYSGQLAKKAVEKAGGS